MTPETLLVEAEAEPTAADTSPLSRLADQDLASILLIRHFENSLLDLFAAGELNGTTHTCLGQEYVPVAVNALLRGGDRVFSNHRGHGHYLARFDDPSGLLAEIMGREGAVCSGVGGSQHLLRDGFLSTGVQGESLPIAVGVALHLKRAGAGDLAAVYIGDGTWGEGAVYEALNLAVLWQLPVLVLVEHNGIAQSTPTELQLAGTIGGRAVAFGAAYHRVVGSDINLIRSDLAPLVSGVRDGRGPLVVEFRTHRLGPHSKGDDSRPDGVVDDARRQDWYLRYPRRFAEQFDELDRLARSRVRAVVSEVTARPLSTWER